MCPDTAANRRTRPRTSLCTAFETYNTMIPTASIKFEYAVLLAESLARGDQLRLGKCCDYGGLIVVERFPHPGRAVPVMRGGTQRDRPMRRAADPHKYGLRFRVRRGLASLFRHCTAAQPA